MRPLARISAILCIATQLVVACGSSQSVSTTSALRDGDITIGAFNFPESDLLATIYAQALARAGYRVIVRLDIGPRELVDPALERGLLEIVPEYAGSALEFLGGQGTHDPIATHIALRTAAARRGLAVLDASPAQNRNGFVVTRSTATQFGLQRLSDLSAYAGRMTLGGPPECPMRSLCLQGLRSVYGLSFESFRPLSSTGPLTVAALRAGQVDVGLLFTTDGLIDTQGLVLLSDDRHLQPAENVTPLINQEVIDHFGPGVADVLNAVSAALRTADLRAMNAQVDQGTSIAEVARVFLDRSTGTSG